jgi:type II secretory pathway pseudopilin PulG
MRPVLAREFAHNVRSRHYQTGLAGLVIVVLLVLLAGFALVQMQGRGISLQASRNSEAIVPMSRIQAALLEFVRVNKRLPCPAAPSLDTGLPVPNGPTVTPPPACNHPDGTVPWAVLGLSANDVLDPWGRKISYRVISGSRSATVAEGLDRSACDSEIIVPALPPQDNLPDLVTGLCKKPVAATPRTLITNLTSIPGLTVYDKGTTINGIAYVLVSHGETGRGAYLLGGQRLLPLPAGGGAEASNAGFGSYAVATPNTTVSIDQTAYFDDVVVYELLIKLIDNSGLAARNWPDIP